MAAAAADVARLVSIFAARGRAERQATIAAIRRRWSALDSWRTPDIARFARQVAPIVAAGQLRAAAQVDSFLAQLEALEFGRTVRPVGVPASAVADQAIRGVAAVEVYERAGPEVWRALDRGATLAQAVAAGGRRAEVAAATDLQLARTHAARHVLGRKRNVTGFRRVLSGTQSCALCVIASTQRYHKSSLLPCHPGCDCTVAPIYGDRDPGQVIDQATLDDLQARVAERFGREDASGRTVADFRSLVVTHEHGELGPVLARTGDRFTGAADIAA